LNALKYASESVFGVIKKRMNGPILREFFYIARRVLKGAIQDVAY